jgi:hypothetical protein
VGCGGHVAIPQGAGPVAAAAPQENRDGYRFRVLVLPTSEPGHFLFGPYLPLQAGGYTLAVKFRAAWVLRPKEPLLTVEIASGEKVLLSEVLSGDANEIAPVAFTVPPGTDGDGNRVEFRFSHHANASLEIRGLQLRGASSKTPKRNRLSAASFLWRSQPLRLFHRSAGRA